MRRNEDDGNPAWRRTQLSLELQAADSRQSEVDQQTRRRLQAVCLQKVLCGGKRLNLEPDRPHEALQRLTHRFVVVHNRDDAAVGMATFDFSAGTACHNALYAQKTIALD